MWAVPVMHPSYTFRQPMALGPLEAHIHGFIARLAKGIPPKPKLLVNPPLSVLQDLVFQCLQRRLALGVDIETSPPKGGRREWALLPGFARLRIIGVGAALGPGVGLSWRYPCKPLIWMELKRAFANPKLVKVTCNGIGYDIPILKRYGMEFK